MTMIFEVKPYIGVGELKFGMSASAIRTILTLHNSKQTRLGFSGEVIYKDYFEDFDLVVGSNYVQVVEYFEFFYAPALKPTVSYKGVYLLETPYAQLLNLFKEWDPNMIEDFDMLTSYELGIGIDRPAEEKGIDALPESVIVFKRGYYEG